MLNPVAVVVAAVVLVPGAGELDGQFATSDAPVIEAAQAKIKGSPAPDTEDQIKSIDDEIKGIDNELGTVAAEICQLSIELSELACPGWFCVKRDDQYIYASRDGRWWFEADGRVIAQADWPEEAMCLDAWNAR